jgi:hypothetical protein
MDTDVAHAVMNLASAPMNASAPPTHRLETAVSDAFTPSDRRPTMAARYPRSVICFHYHLKSKSREIVLDRNRSIVPLSFC